MARYADQYSEAHGGFGEHLSLVIRKQTAAAKGSSNSTSDRNREHKHHRERKHLVLIGRVRLVQLIRITQIGQRPVNHKRKHVLCHRPGHFASDCPHRNSRLAEVANVITSALVEVLTEDPEIEHSVETNQSNQQK